MELRHHHALDLAAADQAAIGLGVVQAAVADARRRGASCGMIDVLGTCAGQDSHRFSACSQEKQGDNAAERE